MRASVLLLSLSACIEVPSSSPQMDGASAWDAAVIVDARVDAIVDASRTDGRIDGTIRDAALDARDAAPPDAQVHDAAQVEAGMLDAGTAATILITELRTRGPSGSNDELVEIANAGSAPLDIGGYKLRVAAASGSVGTRAIVPAGTVLAPGERFLFANVGGSGYSGSAVPDATYTFGIADACGVAITDASMLVLDAIATLEGSPLREGAPRGPLTDDADRSHARRSNPSGVLIDTGDNASDFVTEMPSTPTSRTSSLP